MISKYYSSLVLQLFSIWVLGYIFKIDFITKYLNLYYATILMCGGFVLFIIYLICVKKEQFEISFLLLLIFIHFAPLYITYKYSAKTYMKETLFISVIIYGLIMIYINKNPLKVYLEDKHPSTMNELVMNCRSNKNNYIPACFIFKFINLI